MPMTADAASPPAAYRRHALPVRLAHWINVLAVTILFMSGLNIFDAYPELHWGQQSYSGAPAVLAIGANARPDGQVYGYTRLFGREFDTTGWLEPTDFTDRVHLNVGAGPKVAERLQKQIGELRDREPSK